jgi:hypothetical protein
MSIIPNSRPQISKADLLAHIELAHPDFKIPDFFICGIRGYYEDTMGTVDKNDRNMYDDAIFLVAKDDFIAFNGNTDPAAFRLSIASLNTGVWPVYKLDLHKGQYLALCQRAGSVTVNRDGKGNDTGNFGINIHRGGNWGTSSLGCQTIPPAQWDEFIKSVMDLGKKYYGKPYREQVYTYILLDY